MPHKPLQSIQFGSDGIRGVFGQFPIDLTSLAQLTQALISWLKQQEITQPRLVIGRDTRASGKLILDTILANAAPATIIDIGVLPTPAIAFYAASIKADMAIMITASHNPSEYNGIKLFNAGQGKFSPNEENSLQRLIQSFEASHTNLVSAYQDHHLVAKQAYLDRLRWNFQQHTNAANLDTALRIVIDSAQGACYQVAAELLTSLGARVIEIGNQPNGYNINQKCGSTAPQAVQQKVLESQADMGIAFDGDGDRLLLTDANARLINGDLILMLLAPMFSVAGKGVAGTVMTNLATEHYFKQQHIDFIRTPVGDKYLASELNRRQWLLGSEPSGHILLPSLSNTGDALLACCMVLAYLQQNQTDLTSACQAFESYPQTLLNIKTSDPSLLNGTEARQIIHRTQESHTDCRLVVRASGTEPLIRIMCEGQDKNLNQQLCQRIAEQLMSLNH